MMVLAINVIFHIAVNPSSSSSAHGDISALPVCFREMWLV